MSLFNMLSKCFLIIPNTVVMTILMCYMLILSSVSLLDWFLLIFPLMGHISLLIYMPRNFLLDTTHCDIILLGVGYFYIPINIIEFVLECN